MKPNFFIVGAPKCGTTAMNEYLKSHPDIFMAEKKEMHFFGQDLEMRSRITEQDYLDEFKNATGKRIIGEASVWYLFSKTAAEEIKRFSPGAKILIMLRNPVELLYSLHSQHLYDGNENIGDFATAIKYDKDRARGLKDPGSVDFIKLPGYIDSVLFANQVKRYLDVFGKENVYVVLYEDLARDTTAVVKNVIKFLELSADINIDARVINPNKQIRNFKLHRLIKKPPEMLRRIVRLLLPSKELRERIMNRAFKSNVVIEKRKPMDENLRNELRMLLSDDIDRLSVIINRDLSKWKL